MATPAGEIEVKLTLNKSEFQRLLGDSQKDLKSANDSMLRTVQGFATGLGLALSGAAIFKFLESSLAAFGENEVAVNKLTNALRNQGIASQELVDRLQGVATALQSETGVSDEAILSAQTMLTTFGLQGDQMDKTVRSALDLSASLGIDLTQAATLLGKAFVGETGMLSRYGIVVNKNIDSSKKFETVLGQVNARFGGAAVAQAATYTGRLNIMKQSFNDLMESIGKLLKGPAGGLIQWITGLVKGLSDSFSWTAKNTSGWATFGSIIATTVVTTFRVLLDILLTVISKILMMLSILPKIGGFFADFANKTNALKTEMDGVLALALRGIQSVLAGFGSIKDEAIATSEELFKAIEEPSTFAKDNMAEDVKARTKYYADLKGAQQAFAAEFQVTEADLWDFGRQQVGQFFHAIGEGFADMIMEGKSFGDSLKEIFADLTHAVLAYIGEMIAKMLALLALKAALGAGFGGAGFGIGSLFGAAEGGVIGEPSVITGLRSGRQMLAGEAGPEFIVPQKNMTASEMGGSPSGGGGGGALAITFNINGQFLEADANKWGQLLREKVIPQIQRYTMISPTSNFNRRRGVA